MTIVLYLLNSLNRRDVIVLALLTAVMYGLIQPMTAHMINDRPFDYPLIFRQIETNLYLARPNPLYYRLTLALTHLLPNVTVAYATHLLTIGFYWLTGVVMYLFYLRPASKKPLTAGVWTLGILLVSAITLPTWGQQRLYLGYIVPNVYHNPTMFVLKPLILLLFWCIVRFFDNTKRQGWILIVWAALLSVLATTNKPSYAIALLPALVLLVMFRSIQRKPVPIRALLLGVILPAGFVLIVQYLSGYINSSNNHIIFAPLDFLQAVRAYAGLPQILLQFGLSIAFPATVYLLYRPQAAKHLPLNLSWLVLFVGTGYAYLLNETGYRTHGNFFWSAQSGLFILFVVSAAFLLGHIRDSNSSFTRIDYRMGVCLALLMLHVLCGVVWYLTELTTNTPMWW